MAFAEYSRAVECLEDLVGGGQGRWSPYYRTLYYFEAAIAQLYLAYDNMRKKLGQNDFKSGDGSELDRLNRVFNASKHHIATSEQAVWLTNEGVSTNDGSVTFAELEDRLRQYGRMADQITNQGTKVGKSGTGKSGTSMIGICQGWTQSSESSQQRGRCLQQ